MQSTAPQINVLYSSAEIDDRVKELSYDISELLGEDFNIVAVLKGSFVFTADLLRALYHRGVKPRIDFMTLSSYGTGTQSSGQVEVVRDITDDVAGRKVLLIDDILESGRTLAFARDLLFKKGAAKVAVCVLLDKPGKRRAEVEADFVGFVTPDLFVVGYGLDFAHRYRELPFIGLVENSE